MVLEFWRYRHHSFGGVGCISVGQPVPGRASDGSVQGRPPFETLSNWLIKFPNEVAIAGLADFFSSSPWSGVQRESIPYKGRDPENTSYEVSAAEQGFSIAAILSDLAFNGLDSVQSRVLAGQPAKEKPVQHVNLRGRITRKSMRAKMVPYVGTHPDGYPLFENEGYFRVGYQALAAFDITADNWGIFEWYGGPLYNGLICYLRDALPILRTRVNSGYHNQNWGHVGPTDMEAKQEYSDFRWELPPDDPYGVKSVSYIFDINFRYGPLFESEHARYRITHSWETFPTPWIGTGVSPMAYDIGQAPGCKILQTYHAELLLYEMIPRPDGVQPPYWRGGYAPTFHEEYIRPMHFTSFIETYNEGSHDVDELLNSFDTSYGIALPAPRLVGINAEFHRDLINFQPLRFIAFTNAVSKLFDRLKINMIENLSQFRDLIGLLDFGAYYRTAGQGKQGDIHMLLDVLSSSYLINKYGLLPVKADVNELREGLDGLVQAIKSLSSDLLVGYGTESFTLPEGTYSYRHSRVLASAKVVGHFNLTAFFVGSYILDATGFMPNTERLWDLIQYSFVADKFFSIDKRLKIFDDGIRTAGFVLDYHVSTVRLDVDFDEETLESRSLVASGTTAPSMRVLKRDVSRFAPRLGDSVYDLFPSGKPDWFILGSLMFQASK